MSEVVIKYKCKELGCPIATTGICLEGVLETCTHKYIDDGEENSSENIEAPVIPAQITTEDIYSADILTTSECVRITTASPTRLVILAGSKDAGKTTLLASVIQLFQQDGQIANFLFKGSKTLIGFEKRCFKSRTASMEDKAKTDRTTYKETDDFLHLKVRDPEKKQYDLLFTDLSGERFKDITMRTADSQKFVIAKRADHFALFIDSELISDLGKRHECKINSINILSSLSDADMLNENVRIEIVFSRWDLLTVKGNREIHDQFIDQIKKEIMQKFSIKYKNISFHELASRPENNLAFGFGIDKLFPKWVTESPYTLTSEMLKESLTNKKESKRSFGKY